MKLDINWSDELISDPERENLERNLNHGIAKALEIGGNMDDVEISLTLTDDEEIHELNRLYRGVDRPTDVLSFAMEEDSEDEPEFEIPEDYEDNLLGDIIISVERAKDQAKDYGHSFTRELIYLAVHGTLHLIGYDHEQEEEKVIMRHKEEAVMDALGLTRS